jgi:hypothetical protein
MMLAYVTYLMFWALVIISLVVCLVIALACLVGAMLRQARRNTTWERSITGSIVNGNVELCNLAIRCLDGMDTDVMNSAARSTHHHVQERMKVLRSQVSGGDK